jgi:hypothetical protein
MLYVDVNNGLNSMNWAQIIAAIIVASVAALNLFFTIQISKKKNRLEQTIKYIDRQSDALEAWWIFSITGVVFREAEREKQDRLLLAALWLPNQLRAVAMALTQQPPEKTPAELRTQIVKFVEDKMD